MDMWDKIFQEEEKAIQKAVTKINTGEWDKERAFEYFMKIAPNSLPNKYQRDDPATHARVAFRLSLRLEKALQ